MSSSSPHSRSYPSEIPFGKFKGRNFEEAANDKELIEWIRFLTKSPIPKSADIGRWYLDQLNINSPPGLQIYVSAETNDIQALIAAAREELAELDSAYTEEHQAVGTIRSKLFVLLRPAYEKRDALQIKIEYRRRFLDALLRKDQAEAEIVSEEAKKASEANRESYEQAANEAAEKPVLSDEGQAELRDIYRKLAALYHPDRYANDVSKQKAYAELMKIINQAKDSGAIEILREIARDPNQFLAAHGYEFLNLQDETELKDLELLYKMLQEKIQQSQRLLDELRASGDYELWTLCQQDEAFLDSVARDQIQDLEKDILELESESEALADEIRKLTGPDCPYQI
jgi:DNA polymerase-3 subunit epsilon